MMTQHLWNVSLIQNENLRAEQRVGNVIRLRRVFSRYLPIRWGPKQPPSVPSGFFFFFFFAAAPFNRAEPQPAEEEMKLNRVSDGNPSSQHIYFVSTEQSICGECAVSVCEWILTPVSCRWRKKMWIQRMTEEIYIFFLSCDLRDWSNSK